MTPELITALFAGIGVLILAIGTLISQVAKVLKKAGQIHELTNGSASYARKELKALRETVESLHEQLADSRHETEAAQVELEREAKPR